MLSGFCHSPFAEPAGGLAAHAPRLRHRDRQRGIYSVPGFPSQYKPGRCANHLLQRIIENEIYSMASIKKLIEDVRSVHGFANISTNFCEELISLQKEKEPEATPLLLAPDVKTRWNSTHAMFKRSVIVFVFVWSCICFC
jgi:hypothetical protein